MTYALSEAVDLAVAGGLVLEGERTVLVAVGAQLRGTRLERIEEACQLARLLDVEHLVVAPGEEVGRLVEWNAEVLGEQAIRRSQRRGTDVSVAIDLENHVRRNSSE